MSITEFNRKYLKQGGFAKLHEMVSSNSTNNEIANKFQVSGETVSLWIEEYWGKNYDPRIARRELRIEQILDYMKIHSLAEAEEAFKYENREYFDEAMFLAFEQGIYSNPNQLNLFQKDYPN